MHFTSSELCVLSDRSVTPRLCNNMLQYLVQLRRLTAVYGCGLPYSLLVYSRYDHGRRCCCRVKADRLCQLGHWRRELDRQPRAFFCAETDDETSFVGDALMLCSVDIAL